ncbi:EcsC family protein [Arenibacterium halophilum]|uniref:Protein EcsC n=1 Tax=Arenibacterium halophilum TaxID=2583821 RepID=A0ABY2XDB2_9RHOB|nr:EcsC family protein [Arenibacterium halophilum]TMV15025.1 protein EcsC [Arenibacterium halophilum]
MQDITFPGPVDTEAELDRIAARYRRAGGVGMKVLNLLGGQAEGLLDRLPASVRGGLTGATEKALNVAVGVAQRSRGAIPDQPGWVNTAVGTAMGAAGGFGGLPSALVELPATTTLLLRTIQGVAAEHGFDPAEEGVQFECVRVFAAAGPLDHDNASDLGFVSLRLTLTGGAMHKLIAAVAPRLATVLGQKLAAQTVPVLGAVAGATTNYMFTSYYQDMAHVHFGLRRLAVESSVPHDQLVGQLASRMRVTRA